MAGTPPRPPLALAATLQVALQVTLLAACGDGGARRAEGALDAVVLVTCDTLRADRLGFHGCPEGTSPRLDALARESLVFDSAWSTIPITGPALSALMTGRMPEELGLEGNRSLLAGEARTLAERLSEAGIDTAAVVSNWVLRRRPELDSAGVQQGFAHYDDRMESAEASRADVRERLAPATTDAALAWLDARDGERPFFLWVHYQDPHGPYTAPAEDLVAPAQLPPQSPAEPELEVGPDQRGLGVLPQYQVVDEERRPSAYRARYDAEIRFFDRELGRLLDGLAARGVLERALLVFSADHGESLGEHGYYFSHGQNLHRELVHVPLLLRRPGGSGARRVAAPASHLDLYPTLLSALGLDPGPTRGVDLLAADPPKERVLPHALRGGWSATGAAHRLIVEPGGRRLYDVAADPREERDLALERPDLVRALAEGHRAFVGRVEPLHLAPVRAQLDDEEEHALESLGYAGDDEEREED